MDKFKNKHIENTFSAILRGREVPKSAYVLLLLLFLLGNGATITLSHMSDKTFALAEARIPMSSFTGVASSFANICLILLTIFFRKLGFFTSLTLMILQLPLLIAGIVSGKNPTGIPGLFTNLVTILAIFVIFSNNGRIERIQARMREQALTDRLTGLPNRFACTEFIDDLIKREEKFVLVSIDLNNFKGINDTIGHEAGDKMLIKVADRWKSAADEGSTGTMDFVCRLGGDEFALIIQGYKSEDEVVKTIAHYEMILESKITIDGYDYMINASFGYAEYPTDAKTVGLLMSYADATMYEVKRINSSNHVLRFSPELLKMERALEIERKIRNALEKDAIFFHLQPQYDFSRKLCGFEALARLNDENGDPISPGEFIPVAEKVGIIDKVDSCVLKKSLAFFGELIKKTGTDAVLSVNISVRHLMKKDFLDEIREILAESSVPPKQLEIEITESIMIDSVEKALLCINEIVAMGIRIAIDDFGTGYSSLSYLNRFPANLLKVDKSFVDEMNTDESSRQYVAAIISIGHIMNFKVIAEGVEQPEQLETLRAIGCDYVQGYVWGRPMPADEIEKLMQNNE